MGRVGSCFDNAAAESFFSTLEHEMLSRQHFKTKAQARAVALDWCHNFYNTRRRHSSAGLMAPNQYEKVTAEPRSTDPGLTVGGFYLVDLVGCAGCFGRVCSAGLPASPGGAVVGG